MTGTFRQIRGRRFAEVPFEDALEVPSAMPDPSSMVDDRQVRPAVQDAVAMLSPSQRLATTLFYAEGFSHLAWVWPPVTSILLPLARFRRKRQSS